MNNIFRFILLLVLSLPFQVAKAQTTTAAGARPIALNHIAMYVYDLKKSTAFYEDVLQLQQIPEPFHDGLHTWFTLGPAGQLHLIQGAKQNIKRDKNDHMCFSVSSIEDFISNLDKHQVTYTNWPGTAKAPTVRVDGVKQVYFQDPDGHWIEINNDTSTR